MTLETITLPLQHPSCADCLSYKYAQGTLDSLIRSGITISSAYIVCTAKNTSHALMEARAYEGDPEEYEYHVLVCKADVYCQRRTSDLTFVLLDEID